MNKLFILFLSLCVSGYALAHVKLSFVFEDTMGHSIQNTFTFDNTNSCLLTEKNLAFDITLINQDKDTVTIQTVILDKSKEQPVTILGNPSITLPWNRPGTISTQAATQQKTHPKDSYAYLLTLTASKE